MKTLSDLIESYILDIIKNSDNDSIQLKRMDLSFKFSCVPSQINYVLNTRFTLEKGFLVESKRGGGGYLYIEKIATDDFLKLLKNLENISPELTSMSAKRLLKRFYEEGLLTNRELTIIWQLIKDESLLIEDLNERNNLRSRMMSNLICYLSGEGEKNEMSNL